MCETLKFVVRQGADQPPARAQGVHEHPRAVAGYLVWVASFSFFFFFATHLSSTVRQYHSRGHYRLAAAAQSGQVLEGTPHYLRNAEDHRGAIGLQQAQVSVRGGFRVVSV